MCSNHLFISQIRCCFGQSKKTKFVPGNTVQHTFIISNFSVYEALPLPYEIRWWSHTFEMFRDMVNFNLHCKHYYDWLVSLLQSSAVITRSNVVRYYIRDYRNWGRISPRYRIHKRYTVYPKKYAHGFVVLCFVVVTQSFIMNSHEVFIHIHQGCFAGTGAIVRLPQCQWSKPDGYGKISQCITTTKHSKAKTVCIFLGIYCRVYFVNVCEKIK